MKSYLCVVVFAVWATTLAPTLGLRGKQVHSGTQSGESLEKVGSVKAKSDTTGNGGFSGSESEIEIVTLNLRRIRRKTEHNLIKVKLHNGSYVYRTAKASKASAPRKSERTTPPPSKTRVARGYTEKPKKKKGYRYKKPGYVYTTPSTTTTTRLPPISEYMEDNSSDYVTPPAEDPQGVSPDRGFVTEGPTRSPFDRHDIRDNVPGEPGKDYKVYSTIPETNFTCEGKTPGFYADPETGCQVFHRCTDDPWYTGQVRVTMDSFLCPNGSLFNQQIYTCDWWGNVQCETATDFYQLNEQLGQLEETNSGTVQYVQFGGVRVPPPPGHKRNSPRIVPKSRRQPLPDEYRNKQGYDEFGVPIPENGNSKGLSSSNTEDPDNLVNKYIENDGRFFSEFSATRGSPPPMTDTDKHDDEHTDIGDTVGSSQNVEEVSAKPPKNSRKKSGRKVIKKSKITTTTTTTTTTPAPEDDDEEDDEEEGSDETEENEDEDVDEEEPSATNIETKEKHSPGFIVNRPNDQTPGTPQKVLEPPSFTGDPVEKERSGEESSSEEKSGENGGATYIPPTTTPSTTTTSEGPTYIPPTTEKQEGYSYPKPSSNNYLPPDNTYLPPRNEYGPAPSPNPTYLPPTAAPPSGGYSNPPNNAYLPPPQNNAYLPPPSAGGYSTPQAPNNAYLPPQQNNAYLPPPQNNAYGPPPPGNAYGPPQQTNSYLPPTQNSQYGPPTPPNNTYLPPRNNTKAYGPPQPPSNNAYLPPQQNSQYGPPPQPNNAYLLPQNNAYGPPQQNSQYGPPPTQNSPYGPPTQPNNTYLPPQNNAYGPPQQPTNIAYLPPQQNSQYGPPPTQNSQYGPPNQPNNAYGPPQQPTNNAYLPPPSQPNNTYLPPQSNVYGPPKEGYVSPPPQQPENTYLPPQNQGYTLPPTYLPLQSSNSTNYGLPQAPTNNAYIPPPTPSYLPPTPTTQQQSYPPTNFYLPPQHTTPSYGQPQYLPPTTTERPRPIIYFFLGPGQTPSNLNNYGPPTQANSEHIQQLLKHYGAHNNDLQYFKDQPAVQVSTTSALVPPPREGQKSHSHRRGPGRSSTFQLIPSILVSSSHSQQRNSKR